jgi:drug/metabolite transporter (DMT)-like permease
MLLVLASAALFGFSVPLAKILLADVQPVFLAGILYLGAFLGLTILAMVGAVGERKKTAPAKDDIKWLALVILFGGVLGPVLLLLGLSQTSGFATSLFLNLEGVATALVASAIFKEFTGKRFWAALLCMTIAGAFLSWNPGAGGFSLAGPVFIVLAMLCWGLDNNFTKKISGMEPVEITKAKCLAAGPINLGIGFLLGGNLVLSTTLLYALLVGTFSYGVSIVLFIHALRGWGAARTGAFYSAAPFVGALASILLLNESVGWNLLPAFALMAFGAWLIISEKHEHGHYHGAMYHVHEHFHDEKHQHGHE